MLKKQLITVLAMLTILCSGGCITMAVINTVKEKHPPAPTTANFEALRQMKVLKVEVVDDTKEKHIDTAELAGAMVVAFKKEYAISGHSHVDVRVDDAVAADGRLVVHLTGEEAGLTNPSLGWQGSTWNWKFKYRVEFMAKDGNLLGKAENRYEYYDYSKKRNEEISLQEEQWSKSWQKKYEEKMAEAIVRLIFVYSH